MKKPTLAGMGLSESRYQAAKAWRQKMSWVLLMLFFVGWYLTFHFASGDGALWLFVGFMPISVFIVVFGATYTDQVLAYLNRGYGLAYAYEQAVAHYDAWLLHCQKSFWLSLSGIAFERELAKLFARAGFKAELTPSSGDGGVDIWLHEGSKKAIVQCKAHNKPVGPAVVRELHGTLLNWGASRAILASLSGFTRGVHAYVRNKPIQLMDLDAIIALQRSLGSRETR